MRYCPNCGQKLAFGTEKFCPECGQKLAPKVEGRGTTNIDNTSGDVLVTGISSNKNVLEEEVNNIEKNAGTEIQRIKAGDLHISRNELLLKEIIPKGNEHYYKHEYEEAIECCDNALQIDPNDADAWTSKGAAP